MMQSVSSMYEILFGHTQITRIMINNELDVSCVRFVRSNLLSSADGVKFDVLQRFSECASHGLLVDIGQDNELEMFLKPL